MWENNFLSFRMSSSHRNVHWHFAGRAAKSDETPQDIAPRLTSRKHRASFTSQTKPIMFTSGELWQPNHVTKGRVCKTVLLPLNPSHFLDRKKKCCFGCCAFSFLWQIPCLPWHAPRSFAACQRAMLAQREISSPDPQDVTFPWPLCHPWDRPLWSAECWGSCTGFNSTSLFRSTVCFDTVRRLGSYL